MAQGLLLNYTTIGNPTCFLQSTSIHTTGPTCEDLTVNPSESKQASYHEHKLTPKLTIGRFGSVSHFGQPLNEFDSVSSLSPLQPPSVRLNSCKLSFLKAPNSGYQDLEPAQISTCAVPDLLPELDSGFRKLSESKCDEVLKLTTSSVTPSDLVSLMNNQESLLLLDCRSFMAFNSNHINGALNVCCTNCITRKRLMDGKIKIVDLVSGQEAKELYKSLEDRAEIILYDESSIEMDSLPDTNSLRLLSKCLLKQGKQSKFIQGGLQAFQDAYSFMCSQPDSSAGVPLLFSPTSPEINCEIDTAVASEILPYLFIGNQRDAADRGRLSELGVTHVLNVTSHLPLHFENEGIAYKRLPASDSGSQNLKQYFSEAISFIESARESNGKVLVHCQAGVSRSPTIVAAYLIAKSSKSLNEAFTVIKDRRPIVAPNINFVGQLLEFEQRSVPRSGLCPPPEPVHLL